MDGSSLPDFIQVALQTGSNLLLLILVGLLLTGRLVPRWVYDALKEDRDAWRKTAETNAQTLKQATPVVSKNTELTEQLTQIVVDVLGKKGASP